MELVQNVIVGIIVLGAFATLVRRVVLFVKPSDGEPPCKSCAAGHSCHPAAATAQPSTQHTHPAVLYRPAAR